ncbi:glutathione S-transferase [uncultured Abyssibacter sp.]|uniref:glutathione S-transferase n=1 Tax=uncultured Abyssibacter sp. TaxID=2320202 RepID=UPI0032B16F13
MAEAPPVLYSFRRCPYAIRARMALAVAGVTLEQREVVLRDKPAAMLAISPKGTVPVLQLPDGRVIDESIEVMRWALAQSDPEDWLGANGAETVALIEQNDGPFKQWLDRYKYHVRHPDGSQADYRREAESILADWEQRLVACGGYLLDGRPRLADAALFPFARQFAGVEPQWWSERPFPAVFDWLQRWLSTDRFVGIMRKFKPWRAGDAAIIWTPGR